MKSLAVFLAAIPSLAMAPHGLAAGAPAPQADGWRPFEVIEAVPSPLGSRVTLHSQILDADVTMNLYVPESFGVSSAEHTYPVIFIQGEHGEQFFHALVGMVKHLGDRERVPESIVVSLNDIGAIPDVYTNGMWPAERIPGFGAPDQDVRHLRDEVIPFLESTYRANAYRMIVGVSGSGLFPIYAFTHAPELFRSYVLIAAADMVGMGYRPGESFVDAFDERLAADSTRSVSLYLGVADADLDGRPDYRANLDAMARLKRHEQLDLEVEVFADEDHYAVFLPAMLAAFDQSFPYEKWSARYRDLVAQPGDALDNIDRYYQELSREYGFAILPRADRWNNVNSLRFLIRHLIRLERTGEAVRVAERRAQYRPGTLEALQGLVDAYEADGRVAAAIEAQEKAVERARTVGVGDVEDLEARLLSLKALADSNLAQDPTGPVPR